MDPQATLTLWHQSDDRAERADLAEAYNAWVQGGGFPATVMLYAAPMRVWSLDRVYARIASTMYRDGAITRTVHRDALTLIP